MRTSELRGTRLLAAALLVGSIGIVAYWTAFFTSGVVQASDDPCYLAFEAAFPAADAWTALASLVAAVALWRHRPAAVAWGVAAGSGFVFLGLMDVLYDLEHGMYALHTAEMANEIAINVWCLVVGPVTMRYVWRHRRELDPR